MHTSTHMNITQTVSEYARTTVAAIMGRMKKQRSTRAYTNRAALAYERGQAALVRLLPRHKHTADVHAGMHMSSKMHVL